MQDSGRFFDAVVTLGIGISGYLIAWLLLFPAPALTGPAIAVSISGVAGIKLGIPNTLRDACFVILGLTMGTGVTPEVLDTASAWPISFIALAICVFFIFHGCKSLLQNRFKQDRETAILSSSPGHLSFILGLSTERSADIATVSIVQSIRVLVLTLLVPFVVGLAGFDTSAFAQIGATMLVPVLLASILAALLVGFVFRKIRVPAAFLLAGMLVSTLTHLSGTVEGHVPQWAALPAFIVMGTLIGSRFSGVSMGKLKKSLAAGLAVTFVAIAIATLFSLVLARMTGLPLNQILIAFAPGGVEAMSAMAVIMNADPAFVAAHHVLRLFILTFLAPLALGRK